MTGKQAQLLRFIERYQAEHDGVSPTFREMCTAMDGASLSGIDRTIACLEEQGRVRRSRNRSRSLVVVPQHPDLTGVATDILLAELGRRNINAGVVG